MTALGFLRPGHCAEDDYHRIEQLLAGDIRVELVPDRDGPPAGREDAGWPARSVEELRLAGAEAVVWASTSGSFRRGRDAARAQVRALARAAGMPASATSFGFVNAARELGVRSVAVAAPYPEDVTAAFTEFLRQAGLRVAAAHSAGAAGPAEVAAWGEKELIALVRAADAPEAGALLVPDTALHTVSRLAALERLLGKPVLTANQVSVWEALRLADRRVNASGLGELFTREPLVQV
ncbi:decarboxylase [Streptomyces thermoviolaceus]|uniref:Decarboxylase n=1 Tax=Streptomyces thermoviolaceus subsp. thermoviolaceus TaxID=66860 RepID=A0ABX0Z0S6_STRTL|nr:MULTISPECIES: decarboxylase [Streptomyces]MCM3265679.1 decarboxylase [Streptomyces thermoviolaceus]NJP16820.1 decarboxylase [Streptomyces thermoviolaceus subsp. thermoviolaceus]RSS00779.1 decarboxylase [Streptomyces sp. WAC00469]WTD49099.1 decarboxylase [Streptomyces thermoviolaceus]GGV73683.1 decarboxylase [Streptomyces thermoviolaceus subsp. apingens]